MGFEPMSFPSGNAGGSASGGSKSGNNAACSGAERDIEAVPADPDLAAVVAAWADLPPALRAGILAMVKAATPLSGDR
jgi:hypothetical protein